MRIIPKTWHKSWDGFMKNPQTLIELEQIELKIGTNYCPLEEHVLRFLNVDLSSVKYIIVGMEPYPTLDDSGNPVATGRSFEIGTVSSWLEKYKQSSLRNILKTVYYNETGVIESLENVRKYINNGEFKISSPPEWFEKMEAQGVLFLNASLTVETNNVGSHTEIWDNFMTALTNYINKYNDNVFWMLWGKDALNRISPLLKNDNQIIACHPRLHQFLKDNCFAKANDINWKV